MSEQEKAKLVKGRKRQPKKAAAATVAEREADGLAGPAQTSTHPEEPTDELPKPNLSQRITQSIKQLSQLVATPKEEGGEEVEQTSGKEVPATPAEGGPIGEEEQHDSAERAGWVRRRLRFGTPPNLLAVRTAAPAALALVLLAAALGSWRRGRAASGALEQVGPQLAALQGEGAQHAEALQKLQQAQWQLAGRLASLTAAQQKVQASMAGEAVAAARAEVASLGEGVAQLREAVSQQADSLQQLQMALHLLQQEQQQDAGQDDGSEGAGVGCAAPTSAQPLPPPGLSAEEVAGLVRAEVQGALALFEADRTGLPDYALASAGGRVLAHSRLQHLPTMGGLVGKLAHLFSPHDLHPEADKLLLTPGNGLGDCLPLAGTSGHVELQLAHPIHPTAFTYEHIPAAVAFDIRTAPLTLSIYALPGPAASQSSEASGNATTGSKSDAGGGQLLGRLVYDPSSGRALQTAPLAASSGEVVGRVRVEVEGNHGHPEFTCLYRMRVHGMHA